MTEAGERLIGALEEALAIAQGRQAAGAIYIKGFRYVPAHDVQDLITKATLLVDMLDDAERNHGALIGSKTLTAANDLRLELTRWR